MREKDFNPQRQEFQEMFEKFLNIAIRVLELRSLPEFHFETFIDHPEQPTFGMYVNGENKLYVGLSGRHPNDIFRTIAHELTHYKQDTEHKLDGDSGRTGSPEENEAHAVAGVIMRIFNKTYPDYLRSKPVMEGETDESLKGIAAAGLLGLGMLGGAKDVSSGLLSPELQRAQQQHKVQVKKSPHKFVAPKPVQAKPLPAKAAPLVKVAKANGITGVELAQFLAQMEHESLDFNKMKEIGKKTYFNKYDPRHNPKLASKLGNKNAGDGERYKGRGFIQLTGKTNYIDANNYLKKVNPKIDIVKNPDLAARPDVAAQIAIWYWQEKVRPLVKDFSDTTRVTKLINGGLNGLQDREHNFRDYMASLGLMEKWSMKYKKSINCSNPKGFSQRAHCQGRKKTEDIEQRPQSKKNLVIFDIDDTLLHTTAKIKVLDANGKPIRSLTNQEFNNYVLQPGEQFDFGEFRDAEKFNRESEPIQPMMDRLKDVLANSPNAKAIMLTARADFDDKDTFLKTFKQYGIDMSRVHVHRAGNIPGDAIPAEKKAIWVRKYLNTGNYKAVWLYDDSRSNLSVFKDLKTEYPDVNFHAVYVGPKGQTTTVENNGDFVLEAVVKDQIRAAWKKDGGPVDEYFVRFNKVDQLGYSGRQMFGKSPDLDHPKFSIDYIGTDVGRRALWFYPLKFFLQSSTAYATDMPYAWLVRIRPTAWLQPVGRNDKKILPAPEGKERVGILRLSHTPAAIFFRPEYDVIGKFFDYKGQHKTHGQVKGAPEPTMLQKIRNKFREDRDDVNQQDPGQPIPFPQGTTSVDVSDPYDWYKLGMVISDLDDANPAAFGKGGPSTVIAFGSEDEEHRLLPHLKRLGLKLQDIDKPSDVSKIVPAKAVIDKMEENFADGRNPQDRGDSKRHGIKKGISIAQLKKIRSSDSASPRKKQLAHWQINMRQGRAKKS